ncbi:MAG: hypothetical protein U0R64_07595 [Candidatus Nanopelagicales bacterium]
MTRLGLVPAAPLLLPGIARRAPAEMGPVLEACDRMLADLVSGADEVIIEAAPDLSRDLRPGSASTTGWEVADHLLDRAGFRGVRVRGHPGSERAGDVRIFVADGSAAVGPKAPRPGGGELDERLTAGLDSLDGSSLRALDDGTALAAGCTTAPVWRSLGRWLTPEWVEVMRECWAPFGVTYWVASWTDATGARSPGRPSYR